MSAAGEAVWADVAEAIFAERERRGGKPVRIKRIATEARIDLEKLFGTKVYLELFVKVKSGWASTEQSLRAYGYE